MIAPDGIKVGSSQNRPEIYMDRPKLGIKHHRPPRPIGIDVQDLDGAQDLDSDLPTKLIHMASDEDSSNFIDPLAFKVFDYRNFNNSKFCCPSANSSGFYLRAKRRKDAGLFENEAPEPKQRLTEEKMAARLRSFHISNDLSEHQRYLYQKPPRETFDEIERRLSVDTDEETEPESAEEFAANDRPMIEMSDELKMYVKKQMDERLLVPQILPNPCTDIVLWQPPGNFIEQCVPPKPRRENLFESIRDGESTLKATPLINGFVTPDIDNGDATMEID